LNQKGAANKTNPKVRGLCSDCSKMGLNRSIHDYKEIQYEMPMLREANEVSDFEIWFAIP
jgi:hypothetical protein